MFGKNLTSKTLRIEFSVDSGFSNELSKKQKPGNIENQQKAFHIKKHPVLTVCHY